LRQSFVQPLGVVCDAEPRSAAQWRSLQGKALEEVNNNQTLGLSWDKELQHAIASLIGDQG
jgi:hypothetical protein